MRPTAIGRMLLAGLALSAAGASRAEICYSDSQAFDASTPPTNATAFNCPSAGRATLPQLAQAGWQVVKLTPLVVTNGQGGSAISQQLVLRAGVRVFVNGFESS